MEKQMFLVHKKDYYVIIFNDLKYSTDQFVVGM